jgi:hypothetical protein
VPGLWTREDAGTPYKASFVPFTIADAVGSTTPAPRNTPFHLNYPSDVTENMEVQLFDKWGINALPVLIQAPNFNFTERPSLDGSTLHFQYHFETTAPDVLPADIVAYNDQLERVRNSLEYHISYTPGVSPGSLGAYQPNWMGISVISSAFVIALVLAIALSFVHYYPDDDRRYAYEYARYEGIGGWLICICITLAFGFFGFGRTAIFDLSIIFNQARWDVFTQPGGARYDPMWAPALLFEAISAVSFLVLLSLAAVLMFQKRATFPFVMIAVYVLNLVVTIIDHEMVSRVASMATPGPNQAFATQFTHVIVGCVIWIPYLLVSKRVKATFRD